MKRMTWAALAATTCTAVAIALIAGSDDIRRLRRMQRM